LAKQLVTGLNTGDVEKYALLCGEPERVPKIASMLAGSKKVLQYREYTVFRGDLEGTPVSVASTGIGGPSTAILIEEMANLGARTFIRIGTSGGIADGLGKGDLVISTAAIKADGTSRSYAWQTFPASAHHEAVLALIKAAKARRAKFDVGITFSVDGFYPENKVLGGKDEVVSMCHDGYQLRDRLSRLADVKAMGAKNIEMENSTLFTLGNLFDLRTGAICIVSDVVPWRPTDRKIDFERNMSQCMRIGVDALGILIRWDRSKGSAKHWAPR